MLRLIICFIEKKGTCGILEVVRLLCIVKSDKSNWPVDQCMKTLVLMKHFRISDPPAVKLNSIGIIGYSSKIKISLDIALHVYTDTVHCHWLRVALKQMRF